MASGRSGTSAPPDLTVYGPMEPVERWLYWVGSQTRARAFVVAYGWPTFLGERPGDWEHGPALFHSMFDSAVEVGAAERWC